MPAAGDGSLWGDVGDIFFLLLQARKKGVKRHVLGDSQPQTHHLWKKHFGLGLKY